MTRTVIWFPQESRSYSPCLTRARRPPGHTEPGTRRPAGRPGVRCYRSRRALVRTSPLRHSTSRRATKPGSHLSIGRTDSHESAPSSAGSQPLPTCIDRARHPYDDTPEKVPKKTSTVIRLPAQVISTVVESVFPVSLRRPSRAGRAGGRAGGRPGRAGPDRTSPCGRAAAGRDRRPGFGTRPAPRRRHATGGRNSARDRAGNRHMAGSARDHASARDRARLRHAAYSTDPP